MSFVSNRGIFVILLSLVILSLNGCLGGGGEENSGESKAISQIEMAKGKFDPPKDGRLTKEHVEDYLEVLNKTKQRIIDDGNEAHLKPENYKDDENAAKRRSRIITTARGRVQMELGINNAHWRWIREAMRDARLWKATGRGGKAAKYNHELLKDYKDDIERAQKGLR